MTSYHQTKAIQEVNKLAEPVNNFEILAPSMLSEMLVDESYARRVVDTCLDDLSLSELPLHGRNRIERFLVAYLLTDSVHALQTRTNVMSYDHEAFESLQAKLSFAFDTGYWRNPEAVWRNFDPIQACLDIIESNASHHADEVDPVRPLYDFVLNYNNEDDVAHARNLLCSQPDAFEQFLAQQLHMQDGKQSWNSADSLIADFLAFPQSESMTNQIFEALDAYLMQDPAKHAQRVGAILEISMVLKDIQAPSATWSPSAGEIHDRGIDQNRDNNVQRMLIEEYSSILINRFMNSEESTFGLASLYLGSAGSNLSDILQTQISRLTQHQLQTFLVDLREGVLSEPHAATAIMSAAVLPTSFESAIDKGNSAEIKTEIYNLSRYAFSFAIEKPKFLALSYRTLLSLACADDAAAFADAITPAMIERKKHIGVKHYDTLTADLLLQLREAAISSDKAPSVVEGISATLIAMIDPEHRKSIAGIKKAIDTVLADLSIVSGDVDDNRDPTNLALLVHMLHDTSRTGAAKNIASQRTPRVFSQRINVRYGEAMFQLDVVANPRDLTKAYLGAISTLLRGTVSPVISLQIPYDREIVKRLSQYPDLTKDIHQSLQGGSYFLSEIPLNGDWLMIDEAEENLKELRRTLKLGRLNYHTLDGLHIADSEQKLPSLDLAVIHCGPQGELPGWELEKDPRLASSLMPIAPGRYDLLVGFQRILDAKKILLVVDSSADAIVKDRIVAGEPSNDCPASSLKALVGDKLHIVMQRPYFRDSES